MADTRTVPVTPTIDALATAIADPGSVLPRRHEGELDAHWAARAVRHLIDEQPTFQPLRHSTLALLPLDAFEWGVRQDLPNGEATTPVILDGLYGLEAERTARRLAAHLEHGYVPVRRRTASRWERM